MQRLMQYLANKRLISILYSMQVPTVLHIHRHFGLHFFSQGQVPRGLGFHNPYSSHSLTGLAPTSQENGPGNECGPVTLGGEYGN